MTAMSLLSTAEIQQDLAALGASLRRVTAVVRAARGAAHGSGIVWGADGTIVTNAHVATTGRLVVELPDGGSGAARVAARDAGRDLAVLRLDPDVVRNHPVTVATLGQPSTLRPGELVVSLGHPLGVPHALALGVVHTTGRAPWQRRDAASPALIHTDLRLAPGNSGGPLADVRGRVLGVNAMIVGGVGVAVSVDEVRRFLTTIAPRPRLGATLRPVAVRIAGEGDTVGLGLLVLETAGGGAAERAGILPGDLLLGHAGRAFRTADDLPTLLHDAGPGATVRLDVGRAGRRTTVTVALGAVGDGRRAA
jgi:serine protease Do